MGLFKKSKRRSTRKAEAKALKHKAKVEAKLGHKSERKRVKSANKVEKKVSKAQISSLKAQEKAANVAAEKAARDRLSVGQVKKYLGVARVLAPVLAPVAYRGATYVRGQVDNRRARQLGVGVEQLGDFTGHGARLTARIANAENSTAQILAKNAGHGETNDFGNATHQRLTDLSTAVQAAEQMPTPRRRAAHQAISNELAGIEADLLARLGVR
ncbi:DUF6474 family protein [Antrihabitans cavernicola]|uniref:Uncharacterized protein n=1 Tax=Antrihabitans cavernicola TaxID=2495913 RepID=A0A5A7SGP1_9NOCA|nr:DUF6474 family protein [Spelaeibacter cavernicola]KAA0024784.1 hypothetical protein FOY51_02295 [Spelaeibacter cavernicola]